MAGGCRVGMESTGAETASTQGWASSGAGEGTEGEDSPHRCGQACTLPGADHRLCAG